MSTTQYNRNGVKNDTTVILVLAVAVPRTSHNCSNRSSGSSSKSKEVMITRQFIGQSTTLVYNSMQYTPKLLDISQKSFPCLSGLPSAMYCEYTRSMLAISASVIRSGRCAKPSFRNVAFCPGHYDRTKEYIYIYITSVFLARVTI